MRDYNMRNIELEMCGQRNFTAICAKAKGNQARKGRVKLGTSMRPIWRTDARIANLEIGDLNDAIRENRVLWLATHNRQRCLIRRIYAAVTKILAALREAGFRRMTISMSRPSAVRKFMSRSTENPSSR
jgi:hypothetical protein